MWRKILWIALSALGLLVVSFLGLALAIRLAPYPAIDAPPGVGTFVPGVFHVHTDTSHDGHGTLSEAVKAAEEMGARFLVVTEHNRIWPPEPQMRGRVLVVPGVEISTRHGHLVATGIRDIPPNDGETVRHIAARRGQSYLAHPVNRRRPWADPRNEHFTGFEALSLDSSFREVIEGRDLRRIVLAAAALVGDPRKAGAIVLGRHAEALEKFDELNAVRPVVLTCGVDAHGLPEYRASFGALRMHVDVRDSYEGWGENPRADAHFLQRAIARGRTFCSVPALGDASSFRFAPTLGAVRVEVAADDATIVLFRDGVEVARGKGPSLELPGAPGVWRAEVRLSPGFPYPDDTLWIASPAVRL